MKPRIQLSPTQTEFVRAVREDPRSFDQVAQTLNLGQLRLSQWMQSPKFRRVMGRVMRDIIFQSRVTFTMGARVAQYKLIKFIEGEPGSELTETVRKTCLEFLREFHRCMEWERQQQRRGKKEIKPPSLLAHPDHSPEQMVHMLKILENGHQPAD